MEYWQILVKEKEFNDILIEWNKKINIVSRQKTDIFDLIEDSKLFLDAIDIKEGDNVLDIGTGGGLPGIILAIHQSEANITLVDSIQKKMRVVKDIIKRLDLKNANGICSRAEELAKITGHKHKYDYIVARSVAVLQDLCKWSKDLIKSGGKLVTVKGGNIKGELITAGKLHYVKNIKETSKNERKIITVQF